MKFKDILNPRINKANGQISLDVRKSKLKKAKIDVDELLECDLPVMNKFKEYD